MNKSEHEPVDAESLARACVRTYRWISRADVHAVVVRVGHASLQWATELLAHVRVRQSEVVIDRADGGNDFGANLVRLLACTNTNTDETHCLVFIRRARVLRVLKVNSSRASVPL